MRSVADPAFAAIFIVIMRAGQGPGKWPSKSAISSNSGV